MLTEEQIKRMLQDPKAADWSKLKADDVRMNIGRPMTEEQMRAYCAQNGIQPTIMKRPPPPPPKK